MNETTGGTGEADSPDPTGPATGDSLGVTVVEIQEEMESSFLDYAMSVIISRALPDARDGLKPVHRRILWSMYDQGFRPDRGHVKCARVVGDVMARFHPHGDSAIYDALARMAQPFSLQHPLIDFHGNYGSPEDPPAASRYTECRLDSLAMSMLADIGEDTVDFVDNYSGDFTEPAVLPARLPNLLVNGSQGIAVGMATNIPPHNLAEVIDAVVLLLEDPDAGVEDLMARVHGPDFPTGGQILGRSGFESAYRTGRGSVKMRADVTPAEIAGRNALVVTALPYQVSAGAVARKIADLVNARELEGIADVNDESSGDETRFVIKLKRDANPEVVLNNLWKHTPLQSSFAMNVVALVDGVPRTLSLRDALVAYVTHQIEVVTRRSEFRLAAARSRLHIVEGLLRALDAIDEIIATIRASENTAAARASLMAEPYEFSEEQANHILEMALSRLTRLGRTQLETEAAEKRTLIADLEALLADEHRLRMAIRDELKEISDKFGTERRSVLEIDPGELDIEDLIDDDDLVFTMSASGYVKTVPTDEFRLQGRGGRGVAGAKLKEADSVMHLIHTTAHSYLLFFSNRGRVYRLKAHEVPVASRTARGTSIVNLLSLQDGERIQAVIDTRDYEMNRYLLFATAKGRVKRTKFTAYDSSRKAGLIAIRLRDDDELVAVVPTDGVHDILLSSRLGQTIRFAQDEVREMGRTAAGVIGLRLKHKGDSVVSCAVARPGAALLYVTTGGYGKRTPVAAFNCKGRGGQGNIGSKPTEEKGEVVGTLVVDSGDEILAVTANGVVIRVPVGDVSERSRMASGVRVMNPDPGDEVVAVALVGDDIDGNSNRDPSEHIEAEPDAQ
ncbi:MAG: DNA gyrase subunit A [Acidimicrobiaceae bacterium]|nr:DNA gyrase subunit A [Acidimicrobiaceae bacterium]